MNNFEQETPVVRRRRTCNIFDCFTNPECSLVTNFGLEQFDFGPNRLIKEHSKEQRSRKNIEEAKKCHHDIQSVHQVRIVNQLNLNHDLGSKKSKIPHVHIENVDGEQTCLSYKSISQFTIYGALDGEKSSNQRGNGGYQPLIFQIRERCSLSSQKSREVSEQDKTPRLALAPQKLRYEEIENESIYSRKKDTPLLTNMLQTKGNQIEHQEDCWSQSESESFDSYSCSDSSLLLQEQPPSMPTSAQPLLLQQSNHPSHGLNLLLDDRASPQLQISSSLFFLNDDQESLDDSQFANRNQRDIHEPDMPNGNYNGMRNFQLNNPFGRTFIIINDLEDTEHLGYLNHCPHFDEKTNADSNFSNSSIQEAINSFQGVLSAFINPTHSDISDDCSSIAGQVRLPIKLIQQPIIPEDCCDSSVLDRFDVQSIQSCLNQSNKIKIGRKRRCSSCFKRP